MTLLKAFRCLTLVAAVALMAPPVCMGAQEPADAAPPATLRLVNGDFVAGELQESKRPDLLRWQGTHFATPFDFDLSAISAVDFSVPCESIKPKGEYYFELHGGELLFGSLIGFSGDKVEIDTPHFGRLHVQRNSLERMTRWRDGKNLIYIGPNDLAEWTTNSPKDAWRQEATHLVTGREGARLAGDFHIPPQAIIEIAFSWTSNPRFVLALGTEAKDYQRTFRIEMWKKQLVCLWETKAEADLAAIEKNESKAGRCHLLIYLDQINRRARVYSAEGVLLAEVNLSGADIKSKPKTGIRLYHRQGGLRLERLRVMRCTDDTLHQVDGKKTRLCRADGSIVYGEVEAYDADKKTFAFIEKGKKIFIDADKLGGITWPKSTEAPPRRVRVCLHDGARVGGELSKVNGGRLWLKCPAIYEPLGVQVAHLRGLSVQNTAKMPSVDKGRQGRLEMSGVCLHGCLVDHAELPQQGSLAWHPLGSATASLLKNDLSGKIVYRDRPPPKPPTAVRNTRRNRARPPVRAGLMGRWAKVLAKGAAKPDEVPKPKAPPKKKAPRKPSKLYLRPGDTITCDIQRIDERGITFKSTAYDATFIPHDKVKALVLENRDRGTKITPTKRDRMLTLPRMRRNNPPTHLIRSVKGDYLCANLVSMDDETLTVEVRLEKRRLPREHITRIIWLHEDDTAHDKPKAQQSSERTRVQAIRNDGARTTFLFDKMTDATLLGTSDVLGPCRIDLSKVDQLTIGTMIEQVAQDLPYQRWKLSPAQDPKFVQDEAAQKSGTSGMESALVGQEAPDFKLDMLDGKQFKLKDHRGKVVVLDFWASWCGACIQALPQIDRVVNECQDQDVLLVAVNLEESPKTIKAALKRLELETTVVLDLDGVVANKYAATAIPQTVIIDRSGRVARLFVGGGPQYVDQVSKALQAVLSEKEKQ